VNPFFRGLLQVTGPGDKNAEGIEPRG